MLNQLYQLLAEIFPFEQTDESRRRVLKALGDAFAVFDLAVMHELAEFGEGGFPQIDVIGNNEAAQVDAVDEKGAEVFHRQRIGVVVAGDLSAQRNA